MPLKPIVQQDLSKGTNVVANPWDVGAQQSVYVMNMLLDEHGSVRTRDGELIVTTAPDTRPIVKLFDFVRQDGTIFPLAIQKGPPGTNDLYNRGTVPWTLIGHLGTTYSIPDILTFVNRALIADGYEVPWQYDGTTLSHLTDSGGHVPEGAKHHALHQGFYWVWNTAAANTVLDGPSSLRSSDLNNPNSWPIANQIFVNKDDGDSGHGMGQFTIAESGISPTTSQVLFKTFVAFAMTGVFGSTNPLFTIQKIKSDMGCIAPRTIQFCPGYGLVRLTHRGFALYDGVQDLLISEQVRPLIFGNATFEPIDWEQVFSSYATVVPNPPVYICAVPLCNQPGLRRVFCYDLVRGSWTILEYPNAIATLATILDPAQEN